MEINRIITGSTEMGKTNGSDDAAASWTAATDSNGLNKLNRLLKWQAGCYYYDANGNNQWDSSPYESVYFHRILELNP